MSINKQSIVGAWLALLVILGFILMAIAQPALESQAYNRLTGSHTTYWDALFLELRVQNQPK